MRNLRSRTFITAGTPSPRPTCPTAPRSRPARPASGSRAARCGAATPTRSTSTRPSRRARAARGGLVLRPRARAASARSSSARLARAAGTPPGAGRRALPDLGRGRRRARGFRPEFGAAAPRPRGRRARDPALGPAPHVGARPAAAARRRGRRSTTSKSIEAYLARRLHLHRGAAGTRRARSTASCSTRSRATASSTPARWRCCCGWAACPRASATGFTLRLLRPQGQASTSCATSTPTRGSRRGSPATAG